jgi:hypothetical protein
MTLSFRAEWAILLSGRDFRPVGHAEGNLLFAWHCLRGDCLLALSGLRGAAVFAVRRSGLTTEDLPRSILLRFASAFIGELPAAPARSPHRAHPACETRLCTK